MSNSLWPHELQRIRLPCPSYLPEFAQTHDHCIGDAIQPSQPLSPPSPLALNLSQHQGLFHCVSFSHQVAKILEIQHQSFQGIFRTYFLQDWLILFPCCSKDSQESSPAPQLESNNFLALSLLYGPTLTSIHDYWENHSPDYTDFSWQSDVSDF